MAQVTGHRLQVAGMGEDRTDPCLRIETWVTHLS
jgi:hypothetical protein